LLQVAVIEQPIPPQSLAKLTMIPGDTAGVSTGEQRLAVAVLKQAITDLRSPDVQTREASRAFFHGEDTTMREFWGEVLGIEEGLARYAARLSRASLAGSTAPMGAGRQPVAGTGKEETCNRGDGGNASLVGW
jgi:hypothetical protein